MRVTCLFGCKTESSTKGKCETWNDGFLKVSDGSACLYGYEDWRN